MSQQSHYQWTEVSPVAYQKWQQPGDGVEGHVLAYSPHRGETKFQSEEPCGFIDLHSFAGGVVRVVLDKPALADRVAAAYPAIGDALRIAFDGEKESPRSGSRYKAFRVWTGKLSTQHQDSQQEAPPPQNGNGKARAAAIDPKREMTGDQRTRFAEAVQDAYDDLGDVTVNEVLQKHGVNTASAVVYAKTAAAIAQDLKEARAGMMAGAPMN